jgi:hypothetical protein
MKLLIYKPLFSILAFLLVTAACSDTSTGPDPNGLTGESVSYELTSTGDSGVNGTVTFAERVDGFTQITVDLSEVPEEEEFPVNIYANTSLRGGELLIELGPVGESGESITIISADTDGQTVSYDDLVSINGHVNVHPEEEDTETILAQADVGENGLTGESLSFNLDEENSSGVSGTIEFLERNSGQMLAVIELSGTDPAQTHLARLYSANDEENGEAIFTFSDIEGETGISKTDVYELEDETAFGFDDLEEFEGAVHIYTGEDDATLLAAAQIEPESSEEE